MTNAMSSSPLHRVLDAAEMLVRIEDGFLQTEYNSNAMSAWRQRQSEAVDELRTALRVLYRDDVRVAR